MLNSAVRAQKEEKGKRRGSSRVNTLMLLTLESLNTEVFSVCYTGAYYLYNTENTICIVSAQYR